MRNLLLTLRLALLLLWGLGTTLVAMGQSSFYHQGIMYRVTSSSTVAVASYNFINSMTNLVIPPKIHKPVSFYNEAYDVVMSVTSVDSCAFQGCLMLRSISLPSTVTSIGNRAFSGCTNLTSATLQNGLESIGNSAFYGCTSLTSIALPNSVHTLGWDVFYGCKKLTDVTLSNSIIELNGTFQGCSSLASIKIPSSAVTLDGAFFGCSSLRSVVVPSSVSYIGDKTFKDCSALVSVYLPNSVTVIGQLAFSNTSLTTVVLPSSLTEIQDNAFDQCSKLTKITSRAIEPPLMANRNCFVQDIYDGAVLTTPMIALNAYKTKDWWNLFKNVTGDAALNNVYDFVASGIYYIIIDDSSAYVTYKDGGYNSYTGNVTIPATVSHDGKTYPVTGIANNAFNNCSGLRSVSIPSSVTTISARAFNGCSALSSLTIPTSVTSIAPDAFAGCSGISQLVWNARECWSIGGLPTQNLTAVTIGNEVLALPVGFVANSKITSLSIPNSVTSISSEAFYGCANLSSLTIPLAVASIGNKAFEGCTGVTSLTWNARECYLNGGMPTNQLQKVTIGSNVKVLPHGFAANSKISSLSLPASLVCIGGSAFRNCVNLGNINFPSSLETIGQNAFSGCTGLTEITIPASVTTIGGDAFADCTGLKTVHYNAENCEFNFGSPFNNCPIERIEIGENVITIPDHFADGLRNLTKITIPAAVTSIGYAAFYGCTGLTEITIPAAVTGIGSSAFYGCTGLTEITIPAAVTSIGSSVFSGCTGLTEITIPAAVTSIGSNAFYGCTGLKTIFYNAKNCSDFNSRYHPFNNCPIERIEIGENVTTIPGYFAYCLRNLTKITIPEAVTSIGGSAFYGLTGLTEITIPAAVTSIGSYAFNGCAALSTVMSWPLTPPSLGYSAFYGVPSTMCVYVPAVSVENYKQAYQWNQFEILPMGSKLAKLVVGLPGNVNVQDYANMRLEISSTGEESASQHYALTNKSSYAFGVDYNTSWNVSLTNQYSDVFGKIENVQVGETDVNVNFSSLLKPQDVTLFVKEPNGQDVTAQCKITWLDENGELLLQGNPIKKLPPGRKLKYQVTLPQGLATACSLPATNTYTVKSGSNNIVCQLTAISQVQLSGRVKDATNNQPLFGATISAVQSFDGDVTKTVTAKTDNQGQYSLDASSVPTTLTVAAAGYMSQTVDCDMTGSNTFVVPDVALSPITGAVINVNLTYTPAHLEGESAETQNWYSDYGNVDYEIYNRTTGRAMTGVHVQYPEIVLTEGVSDGDVLELTATSRTEAFKPVKTTVTIAQQRATATINILEKGKVAAKFNKNINPQVVGTLYDAENRMVKSGNYSGESLTMDDLTDGNYKLVTMGKSDFFNSIYDLGQFASAGLQAGEDYAMNAVTVASGLITPVTIGEVPFFDETKFYYTGDRTSFSVNKPDIVVGNYLTFRVQVDFKEQYVSQVKDIQLIVDMPESCQFYENSVMLGANMGAYTIDGNRIIIPIANPDDLVRFCAIPTAPGEFNPSAFVQFKLNGKTITQPIGKATFTAKGLSINTVSHSTDTTIQVNGSGFAAALVKIYDGKVQIGQTKCRADGNWTASVNLYKPYSHSYHHIQAEVETIQGLALWTEKKMIEYNKNAPQLQSICMYHGSSPTVFDYKRLETSPSYYTVSTGVYTFIAKFNRNDSSLIKNLEFKVLSESGMVNGFNGVYDSLQEAWIGSYGYNYYHPVNVLVEYDLDDYYVEVDTIRLQDSENYINDIIDACNQLFANSNKSIIYESENELTVAIELSEEDFIYQNIRKVPREQVKPFEEDGYHFTHDDCDVWIYFNQQDDETKLYLWDNDIAYEILTTDFAEMATTQLAAPHKAWWNALGWISKVYNALPLIGDNEIVSNIESYNHWLDYWTNVCARHTTMHDRLNRAIDALCSNGDYRLRNRSVFISKLRSFDEYCQYFQDRIKDAIDWYKYRVDDKIIVNDILNILNLALSMGISSFQCTKALNVIINRNWMTQLCSDFEMNRITNAFPDLTGLSDGILEAEKSVLQSFQEERNNIEKSFIKLKSEIFKSYRNCIENDEDEAGEFFCPPATPSHDPSGFVYEGVPSNRLQGVTATCYYKNTTEDMYGDSVEEVVLWDAENYGQENPLLTDENGYYRWDVPIGMWQVKYEKEGYETTYSDWLPVPPPQLDVNIGMVQMRQPEVIKARAYTKAVEFEFDKFMFPETLTLQNIKVTDEWGYDVSGTIELLNAEVDDPLAITSIRRAPGTGLTFASKVRFNSDYPFYGNEVTLRVSKRVKSYADLEMSEDYVVTLPIENEMEKIEVDSTVTMLYGDSRQLTVAVVPSYASRGKTLTVRSIAQMIATTDAETYTLNSNGQAVITVHGDLPGQTSLVYGIDGYDLTASTLVNVMMENQMTVAAPTASIASGSEVEKGTAVYLRCATEGATIYYTLDGSCPCDPSPARKVYDGTPIIINGTVTIKAMATAPDLYDSEVATFVYRVGNGTKGDVNGDGEVNIADVNAAIDIILGNTADESTMNRADVNSDGEVNIADVNALIDMILSPANDIRLDVNCDDQLQLDDLTMAPGDVRTVNVILDHAARYSAMQCDITLPAGLSLLDVKAPGTSVTRTGNIGDTTTRVVAYSMNKRQFAPQVPVLALTVKADETLAAGGRLLLTDVVLADNANKAWRIADGAAMVNMASGVNDLNAGEDRVWVEGHTLCISTPQDGTASLVTVNGIMRDLNVKAGVTRHEVEPGIYVVLLNGISHKVIVK